jgi:hypothetical protein
LFIVDNHLAFVKVKKPSATTQLLKRMDKAVLMIFKIKQSGVHGGIFFIKLITCIIEYVFRKIMYISYYILKLHNHQANAKCCGKGFNFLYFWKIRK